MSAVLAVRGTFESKILKSQGHTHTHMYTALVRLLHKVTVESTFEKMYLENVVQRLALGARAGVRLVR